MSDIPVALSHLLANARLKQVPAGQILIYPEDTFSDILIIKEGIVKVHNIDGRGNDKVLHLLKRPSVFPFAFFSGKNIHQTRWFYTTLIDCSLYCVSRHALQDLIESDNPTAVYLFNQFSEEMHEMVVRLDSLEKSNVQDKLLAALQYLIVHHAIKKERGWTQVTFPVTHQLLADIIGLTRESVAIAMKNLADRRVVRNPKTNLLEINSTKLS